MKYLMIALSLTLLTACSMRGFQPPVDQSYWTHPILGARESKTTEEFMQYVRLAHKTMRECGIDPNVEGTFSTSEQMCMEEKGWVYKPIN